jgi:NADP-dependent 3-hydroxy acid dehydrogenase YdfG
VTAEAAADAPVALITVGASGIGAATARRLLAQGHRVTITGRDRKRLGRFAQQLGRSAGLLALVGDAADDQAVTGLAENTRRLVTGDGVGVALIAPGRVATRFRDAAGGPPGVGCWAPTRSSAPSYGRSASPAGSTSTP